MRLARECGLGKLGTVAVDGTKLKANASRHKAMSYERMLKAEATVPERIAQMLVRIAKVKALSPPFKFPLFSIKQHWHERYQEDPANQWLRSEVAYLFLEP